MKYISEISFDVDDFHWVNEVHGLVVDIVIPGITYSCQLLVPFSSETEMGATKEDVKADIANYIAKKMGYSIGE